MATPDDALTKYYYICDTQGNIMARKIIYRSILTVFILSLLSFNYNEDKYYKFLLSATINDSLEIVRKDTNWFKNGVCVQLKIDTVYTPAIKEFKKEKRFYYDGHIFNKSQLFDMKQLEYLSKFKIIRFSISCTGDAFEPPSVYGESNCTSKEQLYYLKQYWKVSRKNPNKTYTVYFFEIEAMNNTDNKKIVLNNIICHLK